MSDESPPRRAWAVLAVVWLLMDALTAFEIAPASVLPLVREGLGVDAAAAGWVTSILFLGMAAGAIPAGAAIDRVGDRTAIVVATAGVVLAALWGWRASVTGAYPPLLAARLVAGVAIVAVWTASVDLVGDVFGPAYQGTALGLLATCVPAGFALGQFATPWLAARVGWAAALLSYGIAAGVVAVALAGVTRGVEAAGTATTPTRAEVRRVLADARVWGLAALAFVTFSLNLFFNNWIPSFLVERFGISLQAGGAFAALFPAVGVVSRASSGVISDRFFGRRRKPLVLLSLAITAPLVLAFEVVAVVAVLIGVLVVVGFVTQIGLALLFPYVRELVEPGVAGTAVAVLNAVGFVGAFGVPILAGELIERGGFAPAFGFAAALAGLGAVVAWRLPDPSDV